MAPITTVLPLSVEDFLHSLARTPTAASLEKRRRQANARDNAADKGKSVENSAPAQEVARKITQRAGRKPAVEAVTLQRNRQIVDRTSRDSLKTDGTSIGQLPHQTSNSPAHENVLRNGTASTAQLHHQASTPSAQECILKSTLAAIKAIESAHIAALEALKTQRSVASTIDHQAVVPEEDDGRFEDADEQEFEEGAPLISMSVDETELVQQAPVRKAAGSLSQSGQLAGDETIQAAQDTTNVEDVLMNYDEPDEQQNQVQDQTIFPQAHNDIPETSAEAVQDQTTMRQPLPCSPQSLKVSRLGQGLGVADEPLDELDLELLQLGDECEDFVIHHPPRSVRDASRDPSLRRYSIKRASQDIYDDEDQLHGDQSQKGSPPKRRKHWRQRSEELEMREIAIRSPQRSERSIDNGDTSASESKDKDSSYKPSASKRKKKKTGNKKRRTKHKTQPVDFGELAFCYSPVRTPFPENEDVELELNDDPIDNLSVQHNISNRTKSRIINPLTRQKKSRDRNRSRKGVPNFSNQLWEFRKLLPIARKLGEPENIVPTYSDGFTRREAKPIGRVMPVYRSRQRLSAISRPIVARMGELTLTESRPNLFDQGRRPRGKAKRAETRTFRQLKRVNSAKPMAETRRGNYVENSALEANIERQDQIHKQVLNHDNEAKASENGLPGPDTVQPQQEEVQMPHPIEAVEIGVERVEDEKLGINHEGTPDELLEEVPDEQSESYSQDRNSPKPASPKSQALPAKTKLRRQVTFNESVEVLQQSLTVSTPRRPRPDTDSVSEGRDEELDDQQMVDSESEQDEGSRAISSDSEELNESESESKSESESESEAESEQDEDNDTDKESDISEGHENGIISHDTVIKIEQKNETEDSENETMEGRDERTDDDSTEEGESTDDGENKGDNLAGESETDDEDYEMLLESQTIRSTQPLAVPDDWLLEQDLLAAVADPMEIDQIEVNEWLGENVGVANTWTIHHIDHYGAGNRRLSNTGHSYNQKFQEQKEQENVWRPRRPVPTNKSIEVNEDITDFSSPAQPYPTKLRHAESIVLRNERKQPSLEIPDSQSQEMSPEILLIPGATSNYFSRASQALETQEPPRTKSQAQIIVGKCRSRSKSLPSRTSLSQSLDSSDFSNDEHDHDIGRRGILSKSQMFRRTLSSLPVVQSQVMGTRESQMSWRPENVISDVGMTGTRSSLRGVGGDLRTLTRRASIEFGTMAHTTKGKRRTPSVPLCRR